MKPRYLMRPIEELCFSTHKMALLSGPRQCGKTTMGRMMLRARRAGGYRSWDEVEFRKLWAKQPRALVPGKTGKRVPLLVLDEIHKHRRWKRTLKGIYDTLEAPCDVLVTGSARLNVYRKGSDSMQGRYFHFRLHPFSLREMHTVESLPVDDMLDSLFRRALRPRRSAEEGLEALLRFGPFPEPLFARSARKARLWQRTRTGLIVREELRDLSRLPELGRIEMMLAILPDRIGAPFSVAAMREDLEVSFDTVKRWMDYMKELFYLYELKPYSRRVPRSLRRGGKVYLWDYGAVPNEPARFENLVAGHLLKACHFWTDTGEGQFDLHYLRNKEKQEIDFLIVRDRVPWLPIEVKLSDTEPSPSWKKFSKILPCKRGLQIVRRPTWKVHKYGDARVLVAGAAEALNYFV
jgi:predicted AAA+ superfamily ATPase